MTTPSGPITTLKQVGNFVGLRVRELLDMINLLELKKADKVEVAKIARWYRTNSLAEMLALEGTARVNDFCLRLDQQTGYILTALPAADPVNWVVALQGGSGGGTGGNASASYIMSFPLTNAIQPAIAHGQGKFPVGISIFDETGMPILAGATNLSTNEIRIRLSETFTGVIHLTFKV